MPPASRGRADPALAARPGRFVSPW